MAASHARHEMILDAGSPATDSDPASTRGGGIGAPTFVDDERLKQLRALNATDFDVTRLIRLCEELNDCYSRENFLAVAALTRIVIDHIPPIFGARNFSQIATSGNIGKSFVRSITHLQNSAKNIADRHLHQQIRKKEGLPNRTQVNFSSDLDVLLEEIVTRLSTEKA